VELESEALVERSQFGARLVAIEAQMLPAERARTIDGPLQQGIRDALAFKSPADGKAVNER
jgi:hypothetical protein